MADKKRKESAGGGEFKNEKKFKKDSKKNTNKNNTMSKGKGPRLLSALRTELDRLNSRISSDSDNGIGSDVGYDVYEYEEEVPQEESRKNRRFDPVENYQYELPKDFKDENVSSDDDDDFGVDGNEGSGNEDDERHLRM